MDEKLAELGRLSGALNEVDGELDRLMAEVAMPEM